MRTRLVAGGRSDSLSRAPRNCPFCGSEHISPVLPTTDAFEFRCSACVHVWYTVEFKRTPVKMKEARPLPHQAKPRIGSG